MTACPACAHAPLEEWRTATTADPALRRAAYPLLRCARCGTAATDAPPQANDVPVLYETGTYRPVEGRVEELIERVRNVTDRARVRMLADAVAPPARVFEAGTGDGRLLAALAARGYEVRGIEPSAWYAEAARSRGLAVETAGLEDVRLPAGSQHAVLLWHVLEHLQDPGAALGRVREWLAPGGALVLGVPNLSALQARFGDRWFHQDVPRHRTHFTERGTRALLDRNGFRIRRVSHFVPEQNLLGMHQSLLNCVTAERNVFFNLLKGRRPRRSADLVVGLVGGALAVPVAVAAELAADALGRGGSIAVAAVRAS